MLRIDATEIVTSCGPAVRLMVMEDERDGRTAIVAELEDGRWLGQPTEYGRFSLFGTVREALDHIGHDWRAEGVPPELEG